MRANKKYDALSIFAILITSYLFIGWANSLEQIEKAAEGVESISAEFIQEKHLKILTEPLVSKGVFYFKAPRSLRWEYISPIRSILVMHNGNIKRFIRRNSGLTEDSSINLQTMQMVLQEITMWLKGHFDDNPNFTADLKAGRKIVLTPKEESLSMMIKRIELMLSSRPGVIKSVTIYESEDSFTNLEFRKVRLNSNVKDSLFREIK